MNKEAMIKFTKVVTCYTPGGGGNNHILDLLVDGVTRMNPQGVEKISDVATALRFIGKLANAAADRAEDPDFVAGVIDALKEPDHNGKFTEERYFNLGDIPYKEKAVI